MKHFLLATLLTASVVSSGFAQQSSGYKLPPTPFNLKVNLTALLMRNLSMQGEFAFHKNFSFCLGGRMMFPYSLSSALGPSANELQNIEMTGYAVTPEIRFYPGKKEKHQAPYGFYLAPYMRYSNFNITASVPLNADPTTGFPGGNVDLGLGYSGWAGGIMMGSQWVIGHFSIDWWIMGLHYGQGSISGTTTSPYFNSYPGIEQDFKNEIESALSGLPFTTQTTVTVNNNTANVDVSGLPFGGIRGGLCLGFAF